MAVYVDDGAEQEGVAGSELAGMQARALRLTNVSGAEQKVYLRSFQFTRQ